MTATPKATKNGKPGYDDTTLPLMEKNQGQFKCVCDVFARLEDKWVGLGWKYLRDPHQYEGELNDII